MKSKGLGKGLNELLSGDVVEKKVKKVSRKVSDNVKIKEESKDNESKILEINVDYIEAGRYQPRKDLQEDDNLISLSESIKSQGVIQPIIVKKNGAKFYEIIAGERRWRAAKIAGLKKIPVVVQNKSEKDLLAMALIENIQREDLSVLEQAEALNRLHLDYKLNQSELADVVGKPRTSIVNLLRLLSLHEDVKDMLTNREIEFGHAKVLLALKGNLQLKVAKIVIEKSLNVKQTERLVNDFKLGKTVKKEKESSTDLQNLELKLSESIGAPVQIFCNRKGKGKLTLSYNSLDELDNIISYFNIEN